MSTTKSLKELENEINEPIIKRLSEIMERMAREPKDYGKRQPGEKGSYELR